MTWPRAPRGGACAFQASSGRSGLLIGVYNVLFKALFAFYCLMIPLRLLADVLNRVTATKELRMLGPINT